MTAAGEVAAEERLEIITLEGVAHVLLNSVARKLAARCGFFPPAQYTRMPLTHFAQSCRQEASRVQAGHHSSPQMIPPTDNLPASQAPKRAASRADKHAMACEPPTHPGSRSPTSPRRRGGAMTLRTVPTAFKPPKIKDELVSSPRHSPHHDTMQGTITQRPAAGRSPLLTYRSKDAHDSQGFRSASTSNARRHERGAVNPSAAGALRNHRPRVASSLSRQLHTRAPAVDDVATSRRAPASLTSQHQTRYMQPMLRESAHEHELVHDAAMHLPGSMDRAPRAVFGFVSAHAVETVVQRPLPDGVSGNDWLASSRSIPASFSAPHPRAHAWQLGAQGAVHVEAAAGAGTPLDTPTSRRSRSRTRVDATLAAANALRPSTLQSASQGRVSMLTPARKSPLRGRGDAALLSPARASPGQLLLAASDGSSEMPRIANPDAHVVLALLSNKLHTS
ncbi:MAG: hypothetical protein EOO65_03505 [Methanosarcinales archaeon]|nr:MAG: hypothetical protein EOO65_03505 [Methanosarcinales archaeon]